MGLRVARTLNSTALLLALGFVVLVLAGCDTAEERAEEHYQTGLELLEEGEVERALLEFRNVFKLNGKHAGARLAYARTQRERGNIREASGQYLLLVEQYPDNLEGRLALAEMALQLGRWEQVERHAKHALQVAPDNLQAQSLNNSVDYFHAVRDKDEAARRDALEVARDLVKQDESLLYSHKIVIDGLIKDSRWEAALNEIAGVLEKSPDDLKMYELRLGILNHLGDRTAFREALEETTENFPDNETIKQSLITYYVSEDDLDSAEAYLRRLADESDEAFPTQRLASFLLQYRGNEAAIAEFDAIIAAGRLSPVPFQSAKAQLKFTTGQRQEAIADLEAVAKDAPRSAEIRDLEVELARMYFQQENSVEARRLIERVLEEDKSHPGASKLKAHWLIQDDETGDAIVLLRDALATTPRDSDLLTLMAQAHEREGNRELMTEMLSLAVDASHNAPAESIRYARILIADEQYLAAEDVLIDALRLSAENINLLGALGAVYIKMEKWDDALGVVTRLRELDSEDASAVAMSLTARSLSAQDRNEDLAELLEGAAENPDTQKSAQIAIFQNRLKNDGPERALEYLDSMLAQTPDDPDFRFFRAGTLVMLQKPAEAESIYRALAAEYPDNPRVWSAIYRMKLFGGNQDEANAVLREALEKHPDNPTLLFALAEEHQNAGRFQESIKVYEQLYEINPNSIVIANNLASMLADHSEGIENLQKAYAVARRLRGSDVPPLQDTYGWIAYRMGNFDEAMPYLRGAAAGLPDDPRVQYHYGMVLLSVNRTTKALDQFLAARELIDPASPPDYLEDLNAKINQLENPGSAPTDQ